MIRWRIWIFLICIEIIFLLITGCAQENTVTGRYQNEAHTIEYIEFGDGTFSHTYYNFTAVTKLGTFKVNNTTLTLYYKDGETTEYNLSDNNAELIPVNENSSLPEVDKYENRFYKWRGELIQ
jgi:hypothetical protein